MKAEFTDDSRAVVRLELPRTEADAAELKRLIDRLIELRAQMSPAFPERPPTPDEMHVIDDPDMAIAPDENAITLSFLHPGVGWIQCRLTPMQARPIAAHLNRLLAETQDPPKH